jgi:adenylate kinase family enzyme
VLEGRRHESGLEPFQVRRFSSPSIAIMAIIKPFIFKYSVGRSLRSLAESEPKPLSENFAIKESLTAGEMVSKDSLDKLMHTNILQLLNKKGIIIDGYPRDLNQVFDFEEKVNGA